MTMRVAWTIAMLAILGVLTVAITVHPDTLVAGSPVAVGTADEDRKLVTDYFTELNAAGKDGSTSQRDFLRRTQHPDFTDRLCDLRGLTLKIEPAMSTLRVDPKWTPPDSSKHPRGLVYVLGVSVSVRKDGSLLGEQIGSERVVVLDGRAYGFAPCPTS
jgi:hypothetical protein